jgi:hypothetical protein
VKGCFARIPRLIACTVFRSTARSPARKR